ncbi:MAG: flagellar filament outer layer protein FlaA [Spirochaetaceae bacterium]|nr:flagellar filament outer layer protein FlaA [Spirochaetaceae bacterium]
MKRIFILLVIAMMAPAAFAEQATLIDFAELVDTTTVGGIPQHEATLIDFAEVAGASFTAAERDLMKSSLFIGNWEVDLNSSAQTAVSQSNTKVLPATVREGAEKYSGQTVLGVRVMFPSEPYNAWALIRPPFEIQAYANPSIINDQGRVVDDPNMAPEDAGTKFENGFGVIKNVGVIKQIGISVYGVNFPHSLSVILQDENNQQVEVFMGYLDFDGWRTLVWDNPNYIEDVRDRELRSYPLYPNLAPMRKLLGFRVYRDGATQGGDFVTYIKDVTVVFDGARLQLEEDINHDDLWGILAERESDRRTAELNRLGNQQVLRFVEQQLQSPPDEDLHEQENEQ